MSMIDDSIEGFSDQVKILYQYGIKTEIKQEKQADVSEPFNVFISGIDVAGPITTNSRSDVNIIMTVNPQTRKILLTTTPRDYYVTIPNVSGEQRDKLTHAGIYGVDASMATLENLYGINIDYYARVNFTSLVKIVDALGGVDVNSDYEFTTLHGNYHIQKGMNHMDGDMALGFARERYSFEDGDNQRGKDQEIVLTAIIKKACSPAILKNANELVAGVSDSVQTNMTSEEISKFINQQVADPTEWNVESQAVSGRGDTQSYCVLVAKESEERLRFLESTSDGFEISEYDFQTRGEGDLFGTRQSGELGLKMANIKRDFKMLLKAKEDADEFINMLLTFETNPEFGPILEELKKVDTLD